MLVATGDRCGWVCEDNGMDRRSWWPWHDRAGSPVEWLWGESAVLGWAWLGADLTEGVGSMGVRCHGQLSTVTWWGGLDGEDP